MPYATLGAAAAKDTAGAHNMIIVAVIFSIAPAFFACYPVFVTHIFMLNNFD
jgi:hypothetical protein